MELQRFFEDSQFCILSILREETFTAFSIDIFKSAVCPQGKPRTEQFQFVSRKDGEQQRGDAKAAICCLYCGSVQHPRAPRGSAFRAPPPQSPVERDSLAPPLPGLGVSSHGWGLMGLQPSSSKAGVWSLTCCRPPPWTEPAAAPTLQKCQSRF